MKTPRPVIGIIACNRFVNEVPAQSVMTRYVAAAIRYADAAALIIPALPELMSADEVAPRLDGLLLTGSPSNVAPEHYGVDDADAGPFDPDRDRQVMAIVAAMRARQRPVFGICRGFQELNVAFGGSLRRGLDATDLAHHAAEDADLDTVFGHAHPVHLSPGGQLEKLYQRSEIQVNSVHYQGVDRLGGGLTVEALAPDGIVEAFSAPRLLAVQWHPEWHTDDNAQSQALFGEFGRMLRQ